MLELKDGIFYVGVKDDVRGAYNNAYLVKGEKTALIDTVSAEFTHEYIKNIEKITPVSEIDYLICNHTEPDKSGAVSRIIELNPDITIIGTIAAIKNIKEIVNTEFNEQIAKNGASIELGNKTLEFHIVPNLNWPDSMVTYEKNSRTLFSCDIFSAYCENDASCEAHDAAVEAYYSDKMLPYADFVRTAMDKLATLDVDIVCTGYGPIINDINSVIAKYTQWSKKMENAKKTIAVFFASNYGYTKEMAKVVYDALMKNDFAINMFDADKTDMQTVISAMNNADAVVFGTPTINRNAAKSIWNIISNIDMVSMRNKPYFVFGSYGWGGEGVMLVHKHLEEMKLRPFAKPFTSILKLSEDKKTELDKYADKFAKSIKI